MNRVAKLKSQLSDKLLPVEKLVNLFICFLAYSFSGWLAETIYMSVYHGHIVKRGFLIGPVCAVYGIGSLLVVLILGHFKTHPFLLFLCAALLTSIVELLAGIFLSRFDIRLWDYSGDFGNIMGFVCFRNTILWGIMSLFLIYIIHPVLGRVISAMSARLKEVVCYSAMACLALDICVSVYSSLHGVNNLALLSQVLARGISFRWMP